MHDVAQTLKKLPLFAGLPDDALAALADAMIPVYLAEGEVLFRLGDPSAALYVIQEGSLKVVLPDVGGGEQLLRQLLAGASIGEMSLIDQSPRTATVIAASDTKLLMLQRQDFIEIIAALPEHTLGALRDIAANLRKEYQDLLTRIPLFEGLPPAVVEELVENLEADSLDEGEVLFHKGDPGDALYIIERGWVKIVTTNAEGGELILNQCGAGETIGEMSLLDREPHSAAVIALTEGTTVLKLNCDDFYAVLGANPQVAQHIMRRLTSRMRFSTTYIEQAIEFARRIAEGDYNFVLNQIQSSRSTIIEEGASAEDRANELLMAFFQLVEGVKKREEELKYQVRQLTIQIDQARRRQEFEAVTQSEFFNNLKATAKKLREERDADED